MKNRKRFLLSSLLVFFICGVAIPLFMINHKKVKADTITDLTGTTWILNNSITYTGDFGVSINFTSNNTNYMYFDVEWDIDLIIRYYTSSTNAIRAFQNDSWQNDNYRTIEIINGTGVSDSNLINFLQTNATQQVSGTQIIHQYWSSLDVMIMHDDEVIGDDDIEYFIHFNEFNQDYNDTEATGLRFLGVQTTGSVHWSYIEAIHPPGVDILYHGTTNNLNNAMLLEFTVGDYMDSDLYTFMDLNGYWFDDMFAYLSGERQGYIEGYHDGHLQGQADGVEYTSLITRIFNGLGGILSIEVFPNITIALLIGLPLLLGVFIIIIKILRG